MMEAKQVVVITDRGGLICLPFLDDNGNRLFF